MSPRVRVRRVSGDCAIHRGPHLRVLKLGVPVCGVGVPRRDGGKSGVVTWSIRQELRGLDGARRRGDWDAPWPAIVGRIRIRGPGETEPGDCICSTGQM